MMSFATPQPLSTTRSPIANWGLEDASTNPRQVDAGRQRPDANDRRAAGEGEPVLVVHRRMRDLDGDVAVHEIVVGQVQESRLLPVLVLNRRIARKVTWPPRLAGPVRIALRAGPSGEIHGKHSSSALGAQVDAGQSTSSPR